ncbi:MAG: BamA/TamA family outer membrane protein [Fidelibacterota bacterium]
MNIRRIVIVTILLLSAVTVLSGQEKGKTGWSIGGIPAVSYDSDTGFLYGAIINAYDYADGSYYPDYKKSIYMEWSRTTKGSGRNVLFMDLKDLFNKGYRATIDISYLTEMALDFYGFNGYETKFNADYIDDSETNSDYITRVYYKHDRKLLRTTMDIQNQLPMAHSRWFAGVGSYNIDVGPVDVDALNEGNQDTLPVGVETLFDSYVNQGVISSDESDGGRVNFFKAGLIYDTRDNEPNPMRGMWTEGLILVASAETGSYSQLVITHRQYFTLKDPDLSFAVRVGYQGKLSGDIPFYMLPFVHSSYKTTDGWGGSKTLRGVLRNRVVGNSVFYGNGEIRWKFKRFALANQNFYLALNAFVDGGEVVQPYDLPESYTPSASNDSFHLGYGGGFRIAMNENFIIAIDKGWPGDPQDGTGGLYIGLGYLF